MNDLATEADLLPTIQTTLEKFSQEEKNLIVEENTITVKGCDLRTPTVPINAHNDHRIAMSMAVVGLTRKIEIDDPKVVDKSYPGFF